MQARFLGSEAAMGLVLAATGLALEKQLDQQALVLERLASVASDLEQLALVASVLASGQIGSH